MATKTELIEKVATSTKESLGVTKKAAAEICDKLFDELTAAIVKGDVVSLHGFGKFVTKQKTLISYPGIKPGAPRTASAGVKKTTRHVQFKASRDLKLALNPVEAPVTPTAQ